MKIQVLTSFIRVLAVYGILFIGTGLFSQSSYAGINIDSAESRINKFSKEDSTWVSGDQLRLQQADLLSRFAAERKQSELEYLRRLNKEAEFYNDQLIRMRNVLFIAISMLLLLGAIIYKAYRDKRKVNRELMLKFAELRLKNTEIGQKNAEIGMMNEALVKANKVLYRKKVLLNEAQRIAGLGSWEYNVTDGTFEWSEHLLKLVFPAGRPSAPFSFRSFLRKVHQDDRQEVYNVIRNVLNRGEALELEFRIDTGFDDIAYLSARAVPVTDTEGKVIVVSGTLQDMTRQKQQEKKLLEAKEHAELANKSKSIFLANMSHEIRTPLNGIIGFTDLLLNECESPQQREYIDHIRKSGDNLLVLLNDILDFNKIEHGRMEIERVNYSLKEMIQQALLPYRLQAAEKGIELLLDFPSGMPEWIIGDPHRTRQLLVNYVSNAIKFTSRGTIAIDVSVVEAGNVKSGEDELVLKFLVSDSGIGIPYGKQDSLFDAFTQADSSTTRKFGGTGLGLAINKQLAILMGGAAGMSSPGKFATATFPGSDFWFTIKVQRGGRTVDTASPHSNQRFSFEKKIKILVAEDNQINQILMKKVLEMMNCEVRMVENGKLALDALEEEVFDAVLLDIQMPVMDGYQTTLMIRQSQWASIPVIGVSANVFREDIRRSLEIGMDAHIGKPFSAKELYEVLNEKLNLAENSGSV